MRAKDFLTELWTQPYPLESRAIGLADREYNFATADDRRGRIVFDSTLDTDQGGTHLLFVVVHFYIDDEFHDTGKGDAIKIFSTVATACQDYLKKFRPPVIVFETESRKKRNLYVRMAQALNNYEIYPDWYKDRELGQEIDNASVNGIREEMIVLRLQNYNPATTRAYVQENLTKSTYQEHEEQLRDFIKWCVRKLKIRQALPKIRFQDAKEGPDQHRTGYYDDNDDIMWIYTGNRNLIDIMRTVAHELVHSKQHEDNRVHGDQSYPGSPMEQEADVVAGYLMKLYGKKNPEIIE